VRAPQPSTAFSKEDTKITKEKKKNSFPNFVAFVPFVVKILFTKLET